MHLAVSLLRTLAAAVADLLSPPACAACDAALSSVAVFCAPCASSFVPAPADEGASRDGPAASDLADTRAVAAYGGAVAEAIVRLKFHRRPDVARPLASLLVPAARSLAGREGFDVVVPVPLHRARLAERAYNQAGLLAAPVARALGASFAPTVLVRARATTAQTSLGRADRVANVAGAFRVPSPRHVAGRRVLLVDDVRTTGATLAVAAQTLRAAGACHVAGLTLAQA